MLMKLKLNGSMKTYKTCRTNTQKRCLFHRRGLECKSRKSGNTWSNRQIWPWSTEWIRAKANRVLPGECTGQSKHSLPTTQEKTLHLDITRWSIPKSDWLYSLQPKIEKLYTVRLNWTQWYPHKLGGQRSPNHEGVPQTSGIGEKNLYFTPPPQHLVQSTISKCSFNNWMCGHPFWSSL